MTVFLNFVHFVHLYIDDNMALYWHGIDVSLTLSESITGHTFQQVYCICHNYTTTI